MTVDGRTKRAEASREQRRAQILERALGVFAEKGYHGASVSDVVKAAGVARGTFYLYFDSKEAVFLDLLDELLATLRAGVGGMDVSRGAASMEDQLQGIVVRLLQTTESNRELTRIIFREAVGLDAAVDAKLREFHDGLHAWLVVALRVGAQLGLVRENDPEIVATCVIGMVRETIHRYVVQSDAPFDADAVARGLVKLAVDGLRP
ncbi:MAG: TetR/AcrR family transcriptional regulator [Alphaproteobacteria bacterium]|nr:TetR/AcrR family transcriptional regulator [Alphaproteobacteria bacterium]